MYRIKTLNKISAVGTSRFGSGYVCGGDAEDPHGILVRSASLHEMEFPKSLLAIARAAVAPPPVLILDEATSHLDTLSEQQILSLLSGMI